MWDYSVWLIQRVGQSDADCEKPDESSLINQQNRFPTDFDEGKTVLGISVLG